MRALALLACLALVALPSAARADEPEPLPALPPPEPVAPAPELPAVPESPPQLPPAVAPVPAPAPPAEAPPPRVVSRFFRPGLLLSYDEALRLFATGSETNFAGRNALQLGETTSFEIPSVPRLPYLDGVFGRFTLGGTLTGTARLRGEQAPNTANKAKPPATSDLAIGARAGVVLPLAERLALWPRLGVLHERSLETSYYWGLTSAVLDARLVYALDADAALTLGVVAMVPLATEEREPSRYETSSSLDGYAARPASPRLSMSAGLTVRLDGADPPRRDEEEGGGPAPLAKWSVLLGVDRAIEVFGYGLVMSSPDDRPGQPHLSEIRVHDAHVGVVDTRGVLPRTPRASVDVVVGRSVTLGVSAGFGRTRSTIYTDFVPAKDDMPTSTAWTFAPRAGVLLPLVSRLSLWPRVGLTYAESSGRRADVGDLGTHHIAFDVDAYFLARVTSRFFVAGGPAGSFPLAGRTDVLSAKRRGDLAITWGGVSGMLGLVL